MNAIDKIRQIRVSKNISQAKVATHIGMSTEGYNRLEKRGGDNITIDQVRLIAQVLDVSILEILGLKTNEKENFERIRELEEANAQYEAGYYIQYDKDVETQYYFETCSDVLNAQLMEKIGTDLYNIIFDEMLWLEKREDLIETINNNFRLPFLMLAGSSFIPEWWSKQHEDIFNALHPFTENEKRIASRHEVEMKKKDSYRKMIEKTTAGKGDFR